MNKSAFLSQFILSPNINIKPTSATLSLKQHFIPSAVLVPLIEENQQIHIVLTQRAWHLNKHAGQMSFPGGKVEQTDSDIYHTALRETHEEIGVSPDNVNVIGKLQTYHTLTGYQITPIVGFLPEKTDFNIDRNEVEQLIKVPLQYFYHKEHYLTLNILKYQRPHLVNFIPYQGHQIWGATAAILKDLAQVK